MAKRTVQKGLTPEEKTIVDNLKAMLAQLEGAGAGDMAGAEGGEEEEGVSMALKAVEQMAGRAPNEELSAEGVSTQPPKKVMGKVVPIAKAVSSDNEVPEGRDSAEDRIEELPDVDDENVKEVAKAIARMLGRRGVRKSAEEDPLMKVASAVAALADEVGVMKTAQVKILEGLGVADRIAEIEKVEKAEQRKPVGTYDHDQVVALVAKSLAEAMKGVGQPVPAGSPQSMDQVRKDMAGVLEIIGRNSLWNPGL